ncbi:putative Alpha- and gamma-adaptin-binding protein p34 [Hypsibius exemplaris]|uniref:Alpha- and gamma-adaptin-binding protein p34 n=1 Tax=Hypsibius exemplaris TaxID=2072580 RepID=A0A1W0X2Y2_HYPEX|nr:putative Alpha- and gamma-adaptin-binding protein p34 [Hypsibius exemplaris]
MEESKASSALVVSCCPSRTGTSIVQEIVGSGDVQLERLETDISVYKWPISTKYYNASVALCVPTYRTVPSSDFAETVEAVVVHFNPRKRESFVDAQIWLKTMDDLYSASVKLLTCDHCQSDDNVTKEELGVFCIENNLELIQLAPTEVDSDEEEFGTIHGISRVRAALHAHSWSNLKLKAQPLRRRHSSSGSDSESPQPAEKERVTGAPDSEGDQEGSEIDDTFCQLFSRLHEFRTTARTLSADDRKDFAEKVAKDFLKSLDVDPEELSD